MYTRASYCRRLLADPISGNCDGIDANGCETPLNTLTNCGTCGSTCSRTNAAATCGGGICTIASCAASYRNCDGTDVNGCEHPLDTLSHCGGCGVACTRPNASATCGTGMCGIASCNAGYGNCGGLSGNGWCSRPRCASFAPVARAAAPCSASPASRSSMRAGWRRWLGLPLMLSSQRRMRGT